MATDRVDFAGYNRCLRLANENTQVILGQHCGGRVLQYSWKEADALMLNPKHDGWTYRLGEAPGLLCPSGGRFDIGPERIIPSHQDLWLGQWSVENTGPLSARMTSVADEAVGTRLVRDFGLPETTSHLTYVQTIENVSDRTTRWCHWSRTFGQGHGICIVPLTPELSRLPKQYVMYSSESEIDFAPDDPAIRVRGGYLEVYDTPARPKLGLDSYAGWFAYLMPNDLLFIKRYQTFPDRVYNEMAGLTLSLWYYKDVVCELEPIGPREKLEPGERASFKEEWWLVEFPFPAVRDALDLGQVTAAAQGAMAGED